MTNLLAISFIKRVIRKFNHHGPWFRVPHKLITVKHIIFYDQVSSYKVKIIIFVLEK